MVEKCDLEGRTALLLAAAAAPSPATLAICEALLCARAELEVVDPQTGEAPLALALRANETAGAGRALMRLLLSRRADPGRRSSRTNETALQSATSFYRKLSEELSGSTRRDPPSNQLIITM